MSIVAVSVATTATVLKAKNYKRIELVIDNQSTQDVFLGDGDGVTTSTGIPLEPGERFTLSQHAGKSQFFYRGAIYGIVAASTSDCRVLELEETRA